MTELDERQLALKKRFESDVLPWTAEWEQILREDPRYFEVYLNFASHHWSKPSLTPRVRELICIAVYAACTTLYAPAVRAHVQNAVRLGASRAEILEVFEAISILGIHALTVGLPVLVEEAGLKADGELSEQQKILKQRYTIERGGFWTPLWDQILRLDPGFFEAYIEFSAHPWHHGVLSPKEREFLYVAVDTSSTHMYVPGLRVHIQNALRHGATVQELVEVLEICSIIGVSSSHMGFPIALDEIKKSQG